MIKGRPSGSSVSGGVCLEVPRFVRVKRQTKVAGTVRDSGKDCSSKEVREKKVTAVFVRKSASTPLKEEGDKRSKEPSTAISPMEDVCTSLGVKRHLSTVHHWEGGLSEGCCAKRTKVEEAEVLVRKSKKKKRGRKVVVPPLKKDHLEEALSYLKAWHNQRETWSFKKKMQLCLLEHMYDSSKVTHTHTHHTPAIHVCAHIVLPFHCMLRVQVKKSSFAILLKYLEGLEGRSKGVEVQKAKQIVEDYDSQQLDDVEGIKSGKVDDRNGETVRVCALRSNRTSPLYRPLPLPTAKAYTRKQYKRAVEVLRVLA